MTDLVSAYHQAITSLLVRTGVSDKMMHVHVGLALYLLAQLLLRTRRGSINALLVVAFAEALNEGMDRLYFGDWRWPDTLGDVFATLAWPVLITLVGKIRRRRWNADRERASEGQRLLTTIAAKPNVPAETAAPVLR